LGDGAPKVILVDEHDTQVGVEDKLRAHQNGAKLHRAISVFVFNSKGETLLQRRAMAKYHSKGKWANACCSHPAPGEGVAEAARRRLREEVGIECDVREAFSFVYRADVGEGLTEHEYDHVFFGDYDGKVRPNGDEVMDYRWVPLGRLRQEVAAKPDEFAPWLRICLDRVAKSYSER
jgi:isopentenyl-diphosphate delta-isomerase